MWISARRAADDGGFAPPWQLVRLALLLAVLGALGYDASSVAMTSLDAQTAADDAAAVGATRWKESGNVHTAYLAALDRVRQDGLTMEPAEFTVDRDGGVTVRTHGVADTVVLSRIAPLRSWAEVSAESSVRPLL